MFNFQYKLAVLVQTSNLEPAVTFCVWPVSTFVQRLSIIVPLFSGREASRCSGEYKITLCTLFFLSTKDGNSFFLLQILSIIQCIKQGKVIYWIFVEKICFESKLPIENIDSWSDIAITQSNWFLLRSK